MVHCYLDGGRGRERGKEEGRREGGLITDNRYNFITNIDNVLSLCYTVANKVTQVKIAIKNILYSMNIVSNYDLACKCCNTCYCPCNDTIACGYTYTV